MNESKSIFKNIYFWQGVALSALVVGGVVGAATFKLYGGSSTASELGANVITVPEGGGELALYAESVLPSKGVKLPIKWNDLGKKMAEAGVIDKEGLLSIYEGRGGLSKDDLKLLEESGNGAITINESNAGYLLNLLWALGLANKNPVLDAGPMQDPNYGGADRFASTGGWTLAKGDPMQYYSKFEWIKLTADQQAKVENVSKGIFRPCCNNSTYFPDCNHGMAMLALLELMAVEGASESEMYQVALKVNAYWFPDTYLTLAKFYKEKRGLDWSKVDPKEALSAEYSSASGYRNIKAQISPVNQGGGGGGCGV